MNKLKNATATLERTTIKLDKNFDKIKSFFLTGKVCVK